jgi:glycosyltransferase involved in cell wall biosynthesis
MLQTSDVTFFSSSILLSEKAKFARHAVLLPNGVDLDAFSKRSKVPSELRAVPRPIVGYSGVIKRQLDLQLMLALAQRNREWSFVFVGPKGNIEGVEEVINKLEELKNVHFLGHRDSADLPAYVRQFDVGILCYVRDEYTRFISPLKLNEYLAAGIPVVGTRIPPLLARSDCLQLADTVEEWESAIARAVNDDSFVERQRELGFEFVRGLDWDSLTLQMITHFEDGLAARGQRSRAR